MSRSCDSSHIRPKKKPSIIVDGVRQTQYVMVDREDFYLNPEFQQLSIYARDLYMSLWWWSWNHGGVPVSVRGIEQAVRPGMSRKSLAKALAEIDHLWPVDVEHNVRRCAPLEAKRRNAQSRILRQIRRNDHKKRGKGAPPTGSPDKSNDVGTDSLTVVSPSSNKIQPHNEPIRNTEPGSAPIPGLPVDPETGEPLEAYDCPRCRRRHWLTWDERAAHVKNGHTCPEAA